MGDDTLAIRIFFNTESGWNSKEDLFRFFGEMRVPASRSAGGKDTSVIINRNYWLADKLYQLSMDVGGELFSYKWCSERMEDEV